MTRIDERYGELLDAARSDPAVIGLVLTGSRGKGFAAEHSDYDVLVIVRDGERSSIGRRFGTDPREGIDLRVMALAEFASYAAWGSPCDWDRYSFEFAAVPVDKTGEIQRLVNEKGVVSGEHRQALVREALDAHINGVYRAMKCLRNANRLGARLEAADAVRHALTAVFALEGRHRPYFGYLERELRARPLRGFPLEVDALLATLDAIVGGVDPEPLQRLLAAVEVVCRREGYAEVIDAWGDDYDWMIRYRP